MGTAPGPESGRFLSFGNSWQLGCMAEGVPRNKGTGGQGKMRHWE